MAARVEKKSDVTRRAPASRSGPGLPLKVYTGLPDARRPRAGASVFLPGAATKRLRSAASSAVTRFAVLGAVAAVSDPHGGCEEYAAGEITTFATSMVLRWWRLANQRAIGNLP